MELKNEIINNELLFASKIKNGEFAIINDVLNNVELCRIKKFFYDCLEMKILMSPTGDDGLRYEFVKVAYKTYLIFCFKKGNINIREKETRGRKPSKEEYQLALRIYNNLQVGEWEFINMDCEERIVRYHLNKLITMENKRSEGKSIKKRFVFENSNNVKTFTRVK